MTSQHTTLLDGRVQLMQSRDGLRASMDSVLLASAVKAKSGEIILDMGCGTGSVGLCVHARIPNLILNGIDIQEKMIALANQNAALNKLSNANYRCADVADKSNYRAESFDGVVMNPPYYKDGERQPSPDETRERAYSGDLNVWIASALHWVKQGGALTLIHRADALGEILSLMNKKFGAIEIWPIHSKGNEPAIRVIVKGIRNRKSPLTIHPAIVLFNSNGEQSEQSKSILQGGGDVSQA